MNKGKLYLLPVPLCEGSITSVLPQQNLDVIQRIKHFIVEDTRTAIRFLVKSGLTRTSEGLFFMEFNEHTRETEDISFLNTLLEGHDTGLLSEAGLPCIADPGSRIVALAHQAGIRVIPMTGPSSITLALMASGFNGQDFAFIGYLPSEKEARKKRLKEIDLICRTKRQTQIFIETPYRNIALFEAMLSYCHPQTLLCIATDLTGDTETISVRPIQEWKGAKPAIHKRNTIFLLYHP
jgi:16S rRNA (cytidine1402-2'-O)-methyltransferase